MQLSDRDKKVGGRAGNKNLCKFLHFGILFKSVTHLSFLLQYKPLLHA